MDARVWGVGEKSENGKGKRKRKNMKMEREDFPSAKKVAFMWPVYFPILTEVVCGLSLSV